MAYPDKNFIFFICEWVNSELFEKESISQLHGMQDLSWVALCIPTTRHARELGITDSDIYFPIQIVHVIKSCFHSATAVNCPLWSDGIVIPGRVDNHVCVGSIVGPSTEFTHNRRSSFEVECHTLLSSLGTFHATLAHGSDALDISDTCILTGAHLP